MTKVLLMGSSRHLDQPGRESFQSCARKIGEQFAKSKASLVVCSSSPNTFDRFVLEGLNSAGGKHSVEAYVPDPEYSEFVAFKDTMTNLTINVTPTKGGWRPNHLRAIRAADLVLSVGGAARGTGTVVYSAEALEKAVLLTRTYGGASEEAWRDFDRYYGDGDKRILMQSVPVPDNWPASLVTLCSDFAKRNPMRRNRLAPGIIATFTAVLLVAAWLLLIAFEPSPPVVWVSVLSIVGTLLGVLLRQAANFKSIDANVVWWEIIQALVVGVILIVFATTLVGVDFFNQIASTDRTTTSLKFGGIALLAGLVLPNFVKWLKGKADSQFPGGSED